MPHFSQNSPQHPNNRAHVFYLALELADLVGTTIAARKWRSMIKVATGVLTDKAARDYTLHMEDLLMVRRTPQNDVFVRKDGLKLLAPA